MNTFLTITMRITKNGSQYVGECLEFPVMTHGKTLDELEGNMEKALALFLAEMGDQDGDCGEDELVKLRVSLPDGA